MQPSQGAKILNEALNADYDDLQERIDENRSAVNLLGICGESPVHISIYKNDIKMLKILLDSGADPNSCNSKGDTAFHVAARLGSLECLELLYDTKRCDLELRNGDFLTALDLASQAVVDADLFDTKLFASWSRTGEHFSDSLPYVSAGRKRCQQYLQRRVEEDRYDSVESIVQRNKDCNIDRNRAARIVRGISGRNQSLYQYKLNYPENINRPDFMVPRDIAFFEDSYECIERVSRTAFVCEYINRSVLLGYHNAQLSIRREQSGIPFER